MYNGASKLLDRGAAPSLVSGIWSGALSVSCRLCGGVAVGYLCAIEYLYVFQGESMYHVVSLCVVRL